jgi:hypothetical protein
MGQPAAVGFDARRGSVALTAVASRATLQQHSGSPPSRRWQYCLESMPLVRLLPTVDHVRMGTESMPLVRLLPTVDHVRMGTIPPAPRRQGAPHRTPRLPAPSRPASAARALDDRRAGSLRARRRPPSRATPPRIECTVASLVDGSSLLGDKPMLVDGAVVDETVGQTSAANWYRLHRCWA